MLTRFAIAPSGFKESLSANAAAEAIAAGVRRVVPHAETDLIPLVDGGEGTARALAAAEGGRLVALPATGPVGQPIGTHFALLPDGTAVVEMAAVAGLSLVPRELRDPGATTTYGVGELIRAALDTGARRILVGCGDSGTSDGGAGALQALGARLLDVDGWELPRGGRELKRLSRIDTSGLDPRLAETDIRVACNPFNVLCGERGVARVFGPQKGATATQVAELAAALEHWAYVLTRDLRVTADLFDGPGTGASGGLGAGLAALGARLLPRFDVLLGRLDLDARLARADLVVTAEGALDHQTPRGKIPAEVARRAKRSGRPVLVLAGTIGEGAHTVRALGVDAYSAILPAPVSLTEALGRGGEFLTDATERALRMIQLGSRLPTGPATARLPAGQAAALVSGTQRPSSVR
ncbi:glycerate kinase [Streptomyces sp. WAC 01529]|uniref:glycerate kinase family protein n=1 Tax=Streptomyces sp. WAC 01529 TaxID=2203205 RepID=UPI000F6F99A6|nr:glycerate kinase [Streptomyces sp. WAC 01529]AZM52818.1 glycerate kinase [Streptomyces sp. WAC 01529]